MQVTAGGQTVTTGTKLDVASLSLATGSKFGSSVAAMNLGSPGADLDGDPDTIDLAVGVAVGPRNITRQNPRFQRHSLNSRSTHLLYTYPY